MRLNCHLDTNFVCKTSGITMSDENSDFPPIEPFKGRSFWPVALRQAGDS